MSGFKYILLLLNFCLCFSLTASVPFQCTLQIEGFPLNEINSVIIPFESYGGLIVIKASINGEEEGNFILDSGANGLVINSKYFKYDQRIEGLAYGVTGQVKDSGEKRLDSLMVDELYFDNVTAQTVDLNHIEVKKKLRLLGLVGYEVLKDFEIQLNYQERFITLSRLNYTGEIIDVLAHIKDKVDSFAFQMGNHIPIIDVTINGKRKRMGLDTGAEYNLLDIRRNKDVMTEFNLIRKLNIGGAGDESEEALAGKLYRLVLGKKYKCGAQSTVLIDMSNLHKIYGVNLDGIVGFEFLSPWIFSINYKKKMLYLHKLKFVKP